MTLVAVLFLLAALPARDADAATRIVKVNNTGNQQCRQSVIIRNSRATVKRSSGCKVRITIRSSGGVSQKVYQNSTSGGASQRIVVRR